MIDSLVDLTGGVSEQMNLNEQEVVKKIENNSLWNLMLKYIIHINIYIHIL